MIGARAAADEKVVSDAAGAIGHIMPRFRAKLGLYGGPSGEDQVMQPYFLGYMKAFALSLVVSR
jgi:hypothetical protein